MAAAVTAHVVWTSNMLEPQLIKGKCSGDICRKEAKLDYFQDLSKTPTWLSGRGRCMRNGRMSLQNHWDWSSKKKKEQKKVNIYLTYSLHGKHFPEYNIVSLRIVRFHLLEIHIKHITVWGHRSFIISGMARWNWWAKLLRFISHCKFYWLTAKNGSYSMLTDDAPCLNAF